MIGAALNFATLASVLQGLTRASRVAEAAAKRLQGEAERLAEAIRAEVPVDDGSLRDSVRVEPTVDPLRVRVVAGGDEPNIKHTGHGTFDEGLMLEYGTSRTPAQPFFWPTVEAMRGSIKANIDDTMNSETSE
jgi:hypothetical protein